MGTAVSDDWDFERARALLRAQVARGASSTPTGPVRVAFRHRVATTVGLAAVASGVVIGSWCAAVGGPVRTTAVTADARPVTATAPTTAGGIPALTTVGPVRVVTVPAPGGGWVQVVVGPVTTTFVGGGVVDTSATPTASRPERAVAPAEVVTPQPLVAAPAPGRSGGDTAVTPPPPRTSTPAPTPAPSVPNPTAPNPTTDPPVSTPVEPPPSPAGPSATSEAPGTPADQNGSGAAQSDETGNSSTS